MRKAVTIAQRHEAVALASILGVEAAAKELGWDRRTVRKWCEQAGKPSELDGNAAAWQRAFDLAHAKVEGFLASGKASAVTAATIMGIAQRNIRDLERERAKAAPQADKPTDASELVDELERYFGEVYPGVDLQTITMTLLGHERLTRGDSDPEPATEESGEETIARWVAVLDGLIAEHGSIAAAQEWQRAEEHRRLEVQLERNRINSERAIASSRQATLDAETRSILAAAEAFLRESSDA